jgi:hypothetical protein
VNLRGVAHPHARWFVDRCEGDAIMADTPEQEEPGFEHDVNELPKDRNSSEETLEDGTPSQDEEASEMEHVQEEAAEERKEGGYQ